MNEQRIAKMAKMVMARAKRGDYLILEKLDGTYHAGIQDGKGIGSFRTLERAESFIAKDMFDALGGGSVDLRPTNSPKIWLIREEIVHSAPEDYTKEWYRRNDWMGEEGMTASTHTAGWWGSGPLDGDTPMDTLAHVSKASTPEEAASRLKNYLKSNHISELYGALGVWDLIATKAPKSYQVAFLDLKTDISSAARKLLKLDEKEMKGGDEGWLGDKWREFVRDNYAKGKPSRKLRGQLRLKAEDIWYIVNVSREYNNGESIDFEVELANDYEYDNKIEPVEIWMEELELLDEEGTPVQIESVDVQIAMGGPDRKKGQQSILVTCDVEVENEEGEFETVTGDIQLDLDQDEGEFDGR